MIFETELALQKKIADLDFEFYENYPVSFVRREVRVGECIPDLLSVHFVNDPDLYSWPQRWSYRHSVIVWLLRNRALDANEIASSFFEPVGRIQPLLKNLISSEIVIKAATGKYTLAQQIENDLKANVIAVEAKLRNWRQALSQAIRYTEFSNIAFVAMDATKVPTKAEFLDQFKKYQVGLCAITLSSMEWIVEPGIREDVLGHEKEHITMSPIIPTTQRFWSRRNNRKDSSQD